MVTNSTLHYHIIKGIIENGFAPGVDELANTMQANKEEVINGLYWMTPMKDSDTGGLLALRNKEFHSVET